MSNFDDVSDLLGPSGNSVKWETPGQVVKGKVVSVKRTQQTDFATRQPKFYADGNPMWQIRIGLEVPGEDEPQVIYAKGQMLKALRDAIGAAGRNNLEENGTLAVKFDKFEPSDKGNPQKIFAVKYEAPVAAMSVDDF